MIHCSNTELKESHYVVLQFTDWDVSTYLLIGSKSYAYRITVPLYSVISHMSSGLCSTLLSNSPHVTGHCQAVLSNSSHVAGICPSVLSSFSHVTGLGPISMSNSSCHWPLSHCTVLIPHMA
jgi:hypothetical protein